MLLEIIMIIAIIKLNNLHIICCRYIKSTAGTADSTVLVRHHSHAMEILDIIMRLEDSRHFTERNKKFCVLLL